jgi:uracil phosphoribosyltransferase
MPAGVMMIRCMLSVVRAGVMMVWCMLCVVPAVRSGMMLFCRVGFSAMA